MKVLPANVARPQPQRQAPSPIAASRTLLPGFLRTPTAQVLALFALFLLVAAPSEGVFTVVPHVAIAVLAAALIELPFLWRKSHGYRFPTSGVITGLFVGFLLAPTESAAVTVWVSALAILSKWVIRSEREHVFNPAAVGLLMAPIVFESNESWWGGLANLSWLGVAILLVTGSFVVGRLNKHGLVLSFLGTYFTVFGLASLVNPEAVAEMFREPFLQSALFLAFFMLTDPPTSPGRWVDQLLFGVIAAVVACAAQLLGAGQTYLLIGLLIANGWLFFRRRAQRRSAFQATSTSHAAEGRVAPGPSVAYETRRAVATRGPRRSPNAI